MKYLLVFIIIMSSSAFAQESYLVDRVNDSSPELDYSINNNEKQNTLFFRVFRKGFRSAGHNISEVTMRTSYDFVSGSAALAMDLLGKSDSFKAEMDGANSSDYTMDTDSKKVRFKLHSNGEKIPFTCNVVFIDARGKIESKRRRMVIMHVVSCKNLENSIVYKAQGALNSFVSTVGRQFSKASNYLAAGGGSSASQTVRE